MRCNNNQCRHHDGIERCGNAEAVIVSSIGQCLLMFDVGIPLELPEPTPVAVQPPIPTHDDLPELPKREDPKPVTQERLLAKIEDLGGSATVRLLQRAFRVYGTDSQKTIDDCNRLVEQGLASWKMVHRFTGGRPTTYIVLKDSKPPADEAVDEIRPATKPAKSDPWQLTPDMVIAWLRSRQGYATAPMIRDRWAKSGCRLPQVDQVIARIVAAKQGRLCSVKFQTGPRREYLVLDGFEPPAPAGAKRKMIRSLQDSDVVEWMQGRNGIATIKDARERFKQLRQPGTSPRIVFERLVTDGLARWEIPPLSLTGNRPSPVCILKGYPIPKAWEDAYRSGAADDLSPYKELVQPDHPLAKPTDLRPGSAEKRDLMQARIAAGLPAVIEGDRTALCLGSLD